jgi:hypothetical protein
VGALSLLRDAHWVLFQCPGMDHGSIFARKLFPCLEYIHVADSDMERSRILKNPDGVFTCVMFSCLGKYPRSISACILFPCPDKTHVLASSQSRISSQPRTLHFNPINQKA